MDKIKKYEKDYMYRICGGQIKHLWVVDFSCIIYGIVTLITRMVKEISLNNLMVPICYLIFTAILSVYLIAGKFLIKEENGNLENRFCNLGIILTTQMFFAWGDMELIDSYYRYGQANLLPWFFVFVTCVTSFFYSFKSFVILYGFNVTVTLLLYFYDEANYVFSLPESVIVFIVLLIYIYVFKHFRELNEFVQQLDYERQVEINKLFTASMNHELRTPLNSIIGNTQIMLSKESLDEKERQITKTIFNSSNTMLQLVNDILDYSKMEAGEFKIINTEFALTDLRENLYSMMIYLAQERGLDYEVQIEEGTPIRLSGDIRRIQQLAVNIISNGIKYTAKGRVHTHLSIKDQMLQMVVIDTGMGMSQDVIDDLFVPYKRLNEEKTAAIQGTGLGMYVVKKLLDQMGGTIHVDSVPNSGTTMILNIPIAILDTEYTYNKEIQNAQISEEELEEKYDFSNKVILTIDDTYMNNKIIESILQNVGATVYSELDAEHGIDFMANNHVDLVLLDHIMPDMDGVECLKQIRNSGKAYQDIPVIMVSGNVDDASRQLFADAKATDMLPKPVLVEQLYETIAKYIG